MTVAESALLRWLLTVVFAGSAAWFLFQALRRGPRAAERISSASHAVMGALMVPMAWPWGMHLPASPQIVLFALATLWFLALAAGGTRFRTSTHGGRPGQLHHAVMMAAMVWMVATMPHFKTAGDQGSEHGGHHASGSDTTGIAAAGPTQDQLPTGITTVTLLLAAFLILSSMGWIATAADTARQNPDTTGQPGSTDPTAPLCSACHAAMSIGMGAMLLSLLW